MSLYHEYRPSVLSEIRGNSEIVDTLKNFLSNPSKMPHAYLFHGPTGCGKTTFARIMKSELHISDIDYREINASNDRGIDAMREIIKNCQFEPMQGPYRMYVLDEAHQLSKDAENALLKILEDTPKHVIFILATTAPDSVLKAIRGRCTMFQVSLLSDKEMKKLLIRITKKEGDSLESEVLEQIVLDAQGHPRNALTILEKVLNTSPEKRLEAAKQTAKSYSQSIELCKALLAKKSWKVVMGVLDGLRGQEPEGIRRHVIGYASGTLLRSDNAQAGLILEEFIEPFYNSGFPGLVYASYAVIKG